MRKIDALMTKLEAFGNQFEQLATTADQRNLATQFNAFVGELSQEFGVPGKETDRHLAPITGQELFWKEHGHESFSALFEEIRTDEAATKREDAHWYGRETFKKILEGKTESPAAEMAEDFGIER
ncbi:MAG TPA: hypothetical protein VG122_25185 [Gemmata sp.]|nr:hypothetical protein [Gemmata sp.]